MFQEPLYFTPKHWSRQRQWPDFTPQPEQEEPELEEIIVADDLSMLNRLCKGGLPHDDEFINDDDEHGIIDSDDDDEHVITDSDY